MGLKVILLYTNPRCGKPTMNVNHFRTEIPWVLDTSMLINPRVFFFCFIDGTMQTKYTSDRNIMENVLYRIHLAEKTHRAYVWFRVSIGPSCKFISSQRYPLQTKVQGLQLNGRTSVNLFQRRGPLDVWLVVGTFFMFPSSWDVDPI